LDSDGIQRLSSNIKKLMNKEERQQLIKEAHERNRETQLLALGTTNATREEILEEVADLDGFREEIRDQQSDRGLTADEQ
jgi:hypothetical protein